MATLDSLKRALRQRATATTSSPKQPLSDLQYCAGMNILMRNPGRKIYDDFIIPQLNQLLNPLFNSRLYVFVLEIDFEAKSLLEYLFSHLRRKIRTYTTFEPNGLFATILKEKLRPISRRKTSFSCLKSPFNIQKTPFVLGDNVESDTGTFEKYDIILFCHSMYDMKPKHRFIEKALNLLVERFQGEMIVVFHRDVTLHLNDLKCHRTVFFSIEVVRVTDDDEILNRFASFMAGFVMRNVHIDKAMRVEWRKTCRILNRREKAHLDHFLFSSLNVMMIFIRHAIALSELTTLMPLTSENKTVKNKKN